MNTGLIHAGMASIDRLVSAESHARTVREPFVATLRHALSDSTAGPRDDGARGAAARFVGMAFLEPMLASLREHSMAAGPFAPTSAERRFGPMLDGLLADRIAEATNFPITDAVARRINGGQERRA
jgi:hypothetical protein